jgi:tetratricopeptide (TPR) repeat protein
MNIFRRKKHQNESSTAAAAAATASSTTDDENQSGNGLTIEYFQIQLLLDCLLRIPYNADDHQELIAMCFEQLNDNHKELRMLNEFKNKYSSNRALWWYLQECFLYKILNYSLESQDIRNLFLFRGILHDIEQQMQQHKCSTPLHVYRSQLMPIELLDQWISSVGQCVVINSFLSATTNQEVALTFLNTNQISKENYERVLLEIDADPRISGSKPFVQIGSLNYSTDENEVLFMFGSIFLINNITCGNDGLYTIELTLYSDNDHEFKQVFDDMKKKYKDKQINLLTFAQVLYDLDKFDEAEEYTNRYLEELPSDHEDTVQCYNLLGLIALARADFEGSLIWYNKALEFRMRRLPKLGDPRIADIHESIGDVYWKQSNLIGI